jgi:small-conductance mechanosensitive channel
MSVEALDTPVHAEESTGALSRSGVLRRLARDKVAVIAALLLTLIGLAAVFAIIAYVFDLPIQGLLATSGVVAIILGLALQSTLGDVFSGLVLSFSRPYRPGDWISLEGGLDGRVIELNWRATHVLTGRRDLAIVPNSTIAKSKIVNASSPSGLHGVTITVQLDAKTAPSTGTEMLAHAILNCRKVALEAVRMAVGRAGRLSSAAFATTSEGARIQR